MKRTRHLASLEKALARRMQRTVWRSLLHARMQMYYHRDGTPYTGTDREQVLAWAQEMQEKRAVALTRFEDGGRLSTIWLGLDHGYPFMRSDKRYRPLIFETLSFSKEGKGDDLWRYATEAEARAGHEAILAQLLAEGRTIQEGS